MEKVISEKILVDVHETIMGWFGVDLTNKQIIEIAKIDRTVWNDMVDDCFDTVARENFGDALICYVLGTGRRWPRYRDGQTVHDEFIAEFENAVGKMGIKLI